MSSQVQLMADSMAGLADDIFLQKAYLALLGRPADPTGVRDYLARLRAGVTRTQIWGELTSSEEAKRFAARRPAVVVPQGAKPVAEGLQQLTSVDDVMALQGPLFVKGAYLALFKREPDTGGFARYMALLKLGTSKTFILMELLNSPEAREKSASLPGLVKTVALYKKAQRKSWGGWYCRNVQGAESDLPADRERRALSYLLADSAST